MALNDFISLHLQSKKKLENDNLNVVIQVKKKMERTCLKV